MYLFANTALSVDGNHIFDVENDGQDNVLTQLITKYFPDIK